uniref:ATP-dependent DNA helicase n=1 Tax=viral metagenome TaxID=1070528 RepID=A0A6C0B3X0_9ZZZZ
MDWKQKLKDFYSYDDFIQPQHKIVKDTRKGYDQLVILPTGSGKSICYQLPAIVSSGFSIIISPLKALIKDQIDNLRKRDILVLSFYGDTTKKEKILLATEIYNHQNTHHLIYTTPETIENNMQFREYLDVLEYRNKLDRFVIDEAHCISQWGNNFRPAYLGLQKIRDFYPTVPIMALTATATPPVQDDIVKLLRFSKYKKYTKSYFRKNLDISIIHKSTPIRVHNRNVLNLIIKEDFRDKSGIIYCQTRKKCEKLSLYLNENGLNTLAYHAGLSKKIRTETETSWKSNEVGIIIATIAFGMGIDKSDVRFVIHNDTPFSIESYYQEIGRAGRDNLPSKCILYYSDADRLAGKKLIKYSFTQTLEYKTTKQEVKKHKTNLKRTIKLLDIFEEFCIDTNTCRHQQISTYLGEKNLESCKTSCDNCIKPLRVLKTVNVSNICFEIVSIIHTLQDSAYKTNIAASFKKRCRHTNKYKTQQITTKRFEKCLTYLRLNKFIKERIIKLKGSYGSMCVYKLYEKAKQILKNNISIDIEI